MGSTKTLATLPTGATIYELKNGGIEYLAGGTNFHMGSHGVGTSANEAGGGYWTGQVYTYFTQNHPGGNVSPEASSRRLRGKG